MCLCIQCKALSRVSSAWLYRTPKFHLHAPRPQVKFGVSSQPQPFSGMKPSSTSNSLPNLGQTRYSMISLMKMAQPVKYDRACINAGLNPHSAPWNRPTLSDVCSQDTLEMHGHPTGYCWWLFVLIHRAAAFPLLWEPTGGNMEVPCLQARPLLKSEILQTWCFWLHWFAWFWAGSV